MSALLPIILSHPRLDDGQRLCRPDVRKGAFPERLREEFSFVLAHGKAEPFRTFGAAEPLNYCRELGVTGGVTSLYLREQKKGRVAFQAHLAHH